MRGSPRLDRQRDLVGADVRHDVDQALAVAEENLQVAHPPLMDQRHLVDRGDRLRGGRRRGCELGLLDVVFGEVRGEPPLERVVRLGLYPRPVGSPSAPAPLPGGPRHGTRAAPAGSRATGARVHAHDRERPVRHAIQIVGGGRLPVLPGRLVVAVRASAWRSRTAARIASSSSAAERASRTAPVVDTPVRQVNVCVHRQGRSWCQAVRRPGRRPEGSPPPPVRRAVRRRAPTPRRRVRERPDERGSVEGPA